MNTPLLPTIEISTGDNPIASVIWLHGLGADGNDFVPVIDDLNIPADKPVRFIFPHAPMRPVTINNGYVMRSWYDISLVSGQLTSNEADIRTSQQFVEVLIEQELKRGIPAEKIFLAGFSQGGVVVLHTGLRHPNPLGGILALSTYLALPALLPLEKNKANAAIPIYMAHGLQDTVIPLSMATFSRDQLIRAGYTVEWHEYSMPHSIVVEEIETISAWLKRLI